MAENNCALLANGSIIIKQGIFLHVKPPADGRAQSGRDRSVSMPVSDTGVFKQLAATEKLRVLY